MCLMKPSYDVYEHWVYLNKVNEKWIQQLQELLFDRKEMFEEEQVYLEMMDVLKDSYTNIMTKARMKEEGLNTKSAIEKLKKSEARQYIYQGVKELEDMNNVLEELKYDIYLFTTDGDEHSKWFNEAKKIFPETYKTLSVDVDNGDDDDDDDEPRVDAREVMIDGKLYYVGANGKYKDWVFDPVEREKVGVLVDGDIVFD